MIDIKKARPISFNGVVGHKRTIESLKKQLANNVPSLSIFIGKEGIGKTTLTKLFAINYTCENPNNGIACMKCNTCKQGITHVIMNNEDTENIKTFRMSDEGGKRGARAIQEQINVVPLGGGNKVIILEECQGMIPEAQQLLLPVLEYIPDNVKIFACTTDKSALLPTFLSRAVEHRMNTPSLNETVALLTDLCAEFNINVVGSAPLIKLAEYFECRPRKCINELNMLLSYGDQITIKTVTDHFNLVEEEMYIEYLDILRGDMGIVLDFINTLTEQDVSIGDFVKGMNEFIIKLITLRYRTVSLPQGIIDKAKNLVKYYDDNDLLKVQSIVAEFAPKFEREEFFRSQFVSMSFKIMNRNSKELLSQPLRTKQQVVLEKQRASEALRSNQQKEKQDFDIQSNDLSDNLAQLLAGTGATIVKDTTKE